MLSVLAALSIAVLVKSPTPPKQSYDPKLDVTIFSTGDVRTGGLTGMSAEFQFRGKTPFRPQTVTVGFGSLRTVEGDQKVADDEMLRWKGVTSLVLSFAGQSFTLPAVEGFKVSTNKTVQLLFGHALEEHVDVQVPTSQFVELVTAPEFTVQIGSDKRTVKGKSLDPLRKLAASVPN